MKSRVTKPVILSLTLATLAGCTPPNLPSITSGHIGCAEDDIVIADDEVSGFTAGTRTWNARCHGRTYYCTMLTVGPSTEVSCKEKASSTRGESAGSSSSRGCQYDTQCKGDRICVRGGCVDPSSGGGDPGDDGGTR